MKKFLVLLIGVLLMATTVNAEDVPMTDVSTFLRQPEANHWISFYDVAGQLFQQGRKDEAVQWFYVGQLRGRVAAQFDPDPSGSPALLASFNEVIGAPINQYAGGDLVNWIRQIDAAQAWDVSHPMTVASLKTIEGLEVDESKFAEVYEKTRAGMRKLREQLAATDPAEFAAQRHANGL